MIHPADAPTSTPASVLMPAGRSGTCPRYCNAAADLKVLVVPAAYPIGGATAASHGLSWSASQQRGRSGHLRRPSPAARGDPVHRPGPPPRGRADRGGPGRGHGAVVRLPLCRLSGSRPPRLGRPCGPWRAIGFAGPRPGSHSRELGSDEEDGREQVAASEAGPGRCSRGERRSLRVGCPPRRP
jgi:hypothetical protein